MKSLKELYRIGTGPSSSHTMAPRKAAEQFLARHTGAAGFRVTLFGSLAATGKGHLTDKALMDAFAPRGCEIVWQPQTELPLHPNGMQFEALSDTGQLSETWASLQCRRRRSSGGRAMKRRAETFMS